MCSYALKAYSHTLHTYSHPATHYPLSARPHKLVPSLYLHAIPPPSPHLLLRRVVWHHGALTVPSLITARYPRPHHTCSCGEWCGIAALSSVFLCWVREAVVFAAAVGMRCQATLYCCWLSYMHVPVACEGDEVVLLRAEGYIQAGIFSLDYVKLDRKFVRERRLHTSKRTKHGELTVRTGWPTVRPVMSSPA